MIAVSQLARRPVEILPVTPPSGLPIGRPSTLSTELIERLGPLIAVRGLTLTTAAALIGLSEPTVRRWRRIGTRLETRLAAGNGEIEHCTPFEMACIHFCSKIAYFESLWEMNTLRILDKLAETNPRVGMWRLAKMFPERYGSSPRSDALRSSDTDTDFASEPFDLHVDAELAELSDETLEQVHALLTGKHATVIRLPDPRAEPSFMLRENSR